MVIGVAAIVLTAIFFVVPFVFIFLIASKDVTESAALEFSWPQNFVLFDNIRQALAARDYLMVIAFINSVILTVSQRRRPGHPQRDGRLRLATPG